MQTFNKKKLINKSEESLFLASKIISFILWLIIIIGTLWIGLLYTIILLLVIIVIQAIFISYIKWYWVKVWENQFKNLHDIKINIANEIWMKKIPDMYVYQMDWMLNAFAMKFLSRYFIVLTAEIIEACDDDEKLKFIIGHELWHIDRWHLFWQWILLPSHMLPWFWNAYSKSCEYTCDNYWMYFWTKNVEKAIRWLAVLAVLGKYSEKLNIEEYNNQAKETSTFWMSLTETKATHPFTSKRVVNLQNFFEWAKIELPKRNWAWVFLAPFMSVWFWVILIYWGIIMASVIIPVFNNWEFAPLNNSSSHYTDENHKEGETEEPKETYDYSEDIKNTKESLPEFWAYYEEYKNDPEWKFELAILDWKQDPTYHTITKRNWGIFYWTYWYYDDNGDYFGWNKEVKIFENNIVYSYIISPYWNYTGISDLRNLKTAIENNK